MLSRRRVFQAFSVPILLLAGAACSGPPLEVVETTPDDVVQELLGEGHSVEVSSCVAGLGESRDTTASLAQLIEACSRAAALLNEPDSPPPTLAMVGPTHYGDDSTLDALWDRCAAGDGSACDELWESSPVGSAYEQFGVTCGDRPEVLDCGDLALEGSNPVDAG